jgi:hypothetical protein
MSAWLGNNLFALTLLVGFLLLLGLLLWLRYRMTVSKARFALATVATLGACAGALLTFLSGPVAIQVANAILNAAKEATGFAWIPLLADTPGPFAMGLGFCSTVVAVFLIYRFSTRAIRTWEGPVTLTVNELANQDQDNNLLLLVQAELARLISRRRDEKANPAAINWQQRQREAPGVPAWHQLARDVFKSAHAEAVFNESSWHDRPEAWVGKMYTIGTDMKPLVLFVFDEEPDELQLQGRIGIIAGDGGSLSESKIFAIFKRGNSSSQKILTVGAVVDVEVWPFRKLLKDGLKLQTYARDLVKRFESEGQGGTTATLQATFVEAHVRKPKGKEHERKPLSEILSLWLADKTRRHLAITGEYGQGKSTAMLAFCVQWAKTYLANGGGSERIPLLIELRGQNPAESDAVAFLSTWAVRYGLNPNQLYNLIRSGEAIVIFEGFDELRNAGRAFDRHEHFNALWGMAFPQTKLIFTGRPNFFLDEEEKNRTLRVDEDAGADGNAFTQLWELALLTIDEVAQVASGYGRDLGKAITRAAEADPAFLEIVSRPSMLPVVATIWPSIEELRNRGYSITSALLLERYIAAEYKRKEAEIENTQREAGTTTYILLPREVREVFTAAVVWKMAGSDSRNTITRRTFNAVIDGSYADVFLRIFQAHDVSDKLIMAVRSFEERFKEETPAERRERVASEIASTGLFVLDPAGGPDNLRFSHKQFYEYMIAKISWIILTYPNSLVTIMLQSVDDENSISKRLLKEDNSIHFLSELIGVDYSSFRHINIIFYYTIKYAIEKMSKSCLSILKIFMNKNTYIFTFLFMALAIPVSIGSTIVFGILAEDVTIGIKVGALLSTIFPIIIGVVGFLLIIIGIIGFSFGVAGIGIIRFIDIYKPDKVIIVDRLLEKTYTVLARRIHFRRKKNADRASECLHLIRAGQKSDIRRKFIKMNFLAPRASLPSIQLTFGPLDK